MPEGRFSEYSAQEQAAKAREWLTTRGLPMTAQNLNRAMAALHTGQDTPSASDTSERVNRNIDRTERRTATRGGSASSRGDANPGDGNREVAGGNNIVNSTAAGNNPPAQRSTVSDPPENPGPARAFSSPAAQAAAEAVDPDAQAAAAARLQAAGSGQATSLGDEMTAAIMGLGIPMLAGRGIAAAAPRVALSMARPGRAQIADEPVQAAGNAGWSPSGRVMDVPTSAGPALPAPSGGGMLPGGGASGAPPMLPGGGPTPMLPGPAGMAVLPPPAAAPAPSRDLLMQFATRPGYSTQMPRSTGPRRGQQPTGDSAPSAQPGTTPQRQLPFSWRRENKPATLREQLARNRAQSVPPSQR